MATRKAAKTRKASSPPKDRNHAALRHQATHQTWTQVVGVRHASERRARPGTRRLQAAQSEADRRFAQALGGTQQTAQIRPYRSAMSMLTFYLNRGGRYLPASWKRTLNTAKDELRAQFGR